MDGFDDVHRLRDEYEAALDSAEGKRAAYHAAIRRLYLSGVSLRDIADRMGISHQRVHEIVGVEPPARKKRRRGKVIGAVLMTLGLLGGLATARGWKVMQHQSVLFVRAEQPKTEEPKPPPCTVDTCPGWRYGVSYRLADGVITGGIGCRCHNRGPTVVTTAEPGTGPKAAVIPYSGGGKPPHVVTVRPGEAWLDISHRADAPSLGTNLFSYSVDPSTGELRKRRDYRAAAVASATATLLTGAALILVHRRRPRKTGLAPA